MGEQLTDRRSYEQSVLENFRRNSSKIVAVLTGDIATIAASTLNDMHFLLESEYEKVCHKERTSTESARLLVDYIKKKQLFDMTQAFLNILKDQQSALVNEIMPPYKAVSNELGEKPLPAASSQGTVTSTSMLEEDVPATKRSKNNDQQPPPQRLTATVAHDETDFPSYAMDASPHGECLIINNVQFSGSEQRNGSDKDAERLKNTFSELGFAIHHRRNLDSADLLKHLREYAKFDHSSRDSFVCCILSHGSEGKVQGCDSVSVSIKALMEPFVARSCPSLVGKPKLFFIQACQGNAAQKGTLPRLQTDDVQQDDDAIQALETDDAQHPDLMEWANFLHEDPSEMETDDVQQEKVPDWADFLIGYSTVPGCVSYRHRKHGAIYVRKLCEVLKSYSPRHDLLKMLTKVNDEVSKEDFEKNGSLVKQMPEPRHTLRRRLFFNIQSSSTDAAEGN